MRATTNRWSDRARGALIAVAVTAAAWTATGLQPVRAVEEWRAPPDDPPVRYTISALLEDGNAPGTRPAIDGTLSVTWRNDSQDAVSSLWFHLYPNAFLNTRSSMLREWAADGWTPPDDVEWGGLVVQSIEMPDGTRLTHEYRSPDDGNPDDRTVARVALPEPVAPGDSRTLEIQFTTQLPSVLRRMGQHQGFVFAAQWYPKLGRYVGHDTGIRTVSEGWYCNQYHRSSEFFADFADYDVTLKLPEHLVTGATGELVESNVDAEAFLRTETWQARGVVDFAWTAQAEFLSETRTIYPLGKPDSKETEGAEQLDESRGADEGAPAEPERIASAREVESAARIEEERARVAAALGLEPADVTLPAVEVTVLLQPEHERQMDRHFAAARAALALYGMWLGPYPYDTLTIVDPAHGGRSAGGMEYPQLVTAGTRIGALPETLRPEGVIVHEIGHQWFMNILASNEAEEAWLDEGFTTYYTSHALDVAYGPRVGSTEILGFHVLTSQMYDLPGMGEAWPERIGLPDWATPPRMDVFRVWRDLSPVTGVRTPTYGTDPIEPLRRRYLRAERWDEMVMPAWEYGSRRSYGVNAYSRPALFIATLRRSLHAEHGVEAGDRAFIRAMREYGRRHRFAHPNGDDFLATFAEVAEMDVAPLVSALIRDSGSIDYAVEEIRSVEEPELDGLVLDQRRLIAAGEAAGNTLERSEVVVRRLGDVVVPVRLQVTRDTGDPDEVAWETIEWDGRDRYRKFVFDGEVVAARLHPYREYLQDIDRRNDSLTTTPNHRPGIKWGVRFLIWLENAAVSYGRFL